MTGRYPGWDDDIDIDCGVFLITMLGAGIALAWTVSGAIWSVIA